MSKSKCWTCDRILPDAEIALCKRNYCTAQTALANVPRTVRTPEANPGQPHPAWSFSVTKDGKFTDEPVDMYDKWSALNHWGVVLREMLK